MLEVLTPLSKVHRVSRQVDPDDFVAVPGIWAKLASDGSVENITTDAPALSCKMVINSASDNKYESHDITIGRISTIEEPGVRCRVDTECYVDSVNVAVGKDLVVSCEDGSEGKLAVEDDLVKTGNYAIVARVEEFDSVNDIMTFVTVSPRTLTVS